MVSDNTSSIAALIREGVGDQRTEWHPKFMAEVATLLESLSARVTQAEEEVAQLTQPWPNLDGPEDDRAFRTSGNPEVGARCGCCRLGLGGEHESRDPKCLANLYPPAPVSGIADQKDRNDG